MNKLKSIHLLSLLLISCIRMYVIETNLILNLNMKNENDGTKFIPFDWVMNPTLSKLEHLNRHFSPIHL